MQEQQASASESQTPAAPETNAAPSAEQNSSVSGLENGGQKPTDSTAGGEQATKNWEQEYSRARTELDSLRRSYGEARKKLITQGTEKNQYGEKLTSLEQQLKNVLDVLNKATGTADDPAQFMEELQRKGPQAIEERLKGTFEKQAKEYQSQIQQMSQSMRALEARFKVKEYASDKTNFPNFAEMQPTMVKVMEGLWEDFRAGLIGNPDAVAIDELIPYLYEQAKLQHSDDAIKAAKSIGADEERARLAEEAKTTVAGGGKVVNPQGVDFSKMTLEQERAFWVKKLGESEY
jgi:hypothetical protein